MQRMHYMAVPGMGAEQTQYHVTLSFTRHRAVTEGAHALEQAPQAGSTAWAGGIAAHRQLLQEGPRHKHTQQVRWLVRTVG